MPSHLSRVHPIFVALLTASVAAAVAFAQKAGDRPTVLEAPLGAPTEPGAVFNVTRVDPDGTVQLRISESVAADAQRAISGSIVEGYYLSVVASSKTSEAPVVLRAQVMDVAEGLKLTARVAPEAVARLKPGVAVRLVRPLGSTTALLRSLPGVMPIAEDNSAASAAATAKLRARSVDNLVRIGLAFHKYFDIHNQFPPAVIEGPDRKPWHSWRVLLLPYLDRKDLYDAYDFNQPWDSVKNRNLLDRMPDVYRDPAYGEAKGSIAHYAALVGKEAFFPPVGAKQPSDVEATLPLGQGGRRIVDITDGTSNTIMVAPVEPGRKIPWTKPEDIAVGPEFPGIGKPGGIATPYTLGGKSGAVGVAPILFADSSVHLVVATINPRTLNALMSVNYGEIIAAGAVPEDFSSRRPANKVLKIRVVGDKVTATIDDAEESAGAAPQGKAQERAVEKVMPAESFLKTQGKGRRN
jgi:hypothetical protein